MKSTVRKSGAFLFKGQIQVNASRAQKVDGPGPWAGILWVIHWIVVLNKLIVNGKYTSNRRCEFEKVHVKIDTETDLVHEIALGHPEFSLKVVLAIVLIAREIIVIRYPSNDVGTDVVQSVGA